MTEKKKWKRIVKIVFHYRRASQPTGTPTARAKIMEAIGANSCPLTLLPIDRLTPNADRSYKLFSELRKN